MKEVSPTELRNALERIALLDEADGHELTRSHALEAVAIATSTLGMHPSEIFAARFATEYIHNQDQR